MDVVNSIIMTVFNREPHVIFNTLQALTRNNLDNCEVIIVDDGSTIDYPVGKYACDLPLTWYRIEPDEYPKGTYSIEHPDGGRINNPAFAMNKALGWAKGRRIMFLSSDCMIPKFGIKEAKKCGDSYWVASVMDQASNLMYVAETRPLPFHFFASCKKEHIEAIGGFDEGFMRGIAFEDNDFGARLGLYCRHVIFDLSVLCIHQSHPPFAYSDGQLGWANNSAYIREKWGGIPWEIDSGKLDPIIKNPSRTDKAYLCNPMLNDGFPDPLDGKRR